MLQESASLLCAALDRTTAAVPCNRSASMVTKSSRAFGPDAECHASRRGCRKPVPPTIRSILDSCSRDFSSRLRTTHRPSPARRALISPPAPRPLYPAVLHGCVFVDHRAFESACTPRRSNALRRQANPSRPTASRGAARDIFPRQFPRLPSWPARARVLPSGSRQTFSAGSYLFQPSQVHLRQRERPKLLFVRTSSARSRTLPNAKSSKFFGAPEATVLGAWRCA